MKKELYLGLDVHKDCDHHGDGAAAETTKGARGKCARAVRSATICTNLTHLD